MARGLLLQAFFEFSFLVERGHLLLERSNNEPSAEATRRALSVPQISEHLVRVATGGLTEAIFSIKSFAGTSESSLESLVFLLDAVQVRTCTVESVPCMFPITHCSREGSFWRDSEEPAEN
ncbi:hypothetical protein CSUI_009018 [Cystoisospora suis]|uniref:Uncharacterized protein n=1 Tax=Cystoisospora suis TaxID=483139 RepID=A0A2C6JJW0_9APIC|nr:hypothetical protein CSUI_009018 [Cystoisospora suis]